MSLPIFDSNVFIDSFSNTPESQKLEKLLSDGGFYNEYILVEVSNWLNNKINAYISHKFVKDLLASKKLVILAITDQDKLKALEIMQKYLDQKLSFVDAVILAQGHRLGKIVFTSDQKMHFFNSEKVLQPY